MSATSRPYEMVDMIWQPPRRRGIHRSIDRRLPEHSKYYGHWGFTIYRTHYAPESDKQWETLLDSLRRQTMLALSYYDTEPWSEESMWENRVHQLIYHCKGQEEYTNDINRLKHTWAL